MRSAALVLPAALLLLLLAVLATAHVHSYDKGDYVPFKVNKIGPFANPQETYDYYSLPFCKPSERKDRHAHTNLKDELSGDHWAKALYDIHFLEEIKQQHLCDVQLTPEKVRSFKKAISRFFYFEMVYDDLPVRGFIGTVDRQSSPPRFFLYKHLHFHVLYNGPHVIHVNVSADWRYIHQLSADPFKDENLGSVDFSYSASWEETTVPYERRHELGPKQFFEKDIQWLSVMNSFVLVVLLVGFIAIIIMRVLKSDYTRYSAEEGDGEDEYGWKLVHGDVFRFPQQKMLLASLLGNGVQFLFLTTFLLSLAALNFFYEGSHRNMKLAAIMIYIFTCAIAGYYSSSFYKKIGGTSWAWNIILTSILFVGPLALVVLGLNTWTHFYPGRLTITMSFSTLFIFFAMWAIVALPSTVLGGIAGRRMAGDFEAPVRTKNFAREIPSLPWYRDAPVAMLIGGFLPFSAIYIELYYLFGSLWGHSSYTLFSMLFLVFVLLLIVTSCITIALIYFQLSMEDYRWWWRSYMYGGSCAFFVFGYAWFYYFMRSQMTGALQTGLYFSYMGLICYYFFIMLGSVGFLSALTFIRYIYKSLRIN